MDSRLGSSKGGIRWYCIILHLRWREIEIILHLRRHILLVYFEGTFFWFWLIERVRCPWLLVVRSCLNEYSQWSTVDAGLRWGKATVVDKRLRPAASHDWNDEIATPDATINPSNSTKDETLKHLIATLNNIDLLAAESMVLWDWVHSPRLEQGFSCVKKRGSVRLSSEARLLLLSFSLDSLIPVIS